MKISLNWLREFVDTSIGAAELGKKITNVGLAVDGIEPHGSDSVFELDVTTNRPDCLNHRGVAREVGTFLDTAVRQPQFQLRESALKTEDVFSVNIGDSEGCGRYCGRFIGGVKIAPSPDWLRERLEAVGVRSINNVADVTNYVLMELGQPLHAFDADAIARRQIVVRRAGVEETLVTLDGVKRILQPSDLVIADAQSAIALAGVMGGVASEISAKTTNIFLESAYFNPQSIRKSARRLGMNTEASYRFERGCDIEIADYACARAAAMIQQLAGGDIAGAPIDVYPGKRTRPTAVLRRARLREFLGAEVADAIVERIFARLEFEAARTGSGWSVVVPSFRVDVSTEHDLLEEIARHHGFDKFPATLPSWRGYGAWLPHEAAERQLRNVLSNSGYSEITTGAFSDEAGERYFRPDRVPVQFHNPMSEDAAVLRTSLVPGILKTLQWNLNRGSHDLQFFELAKVYSKSGEQRALVLAACGAVRGQNVNETARDLGFFDLKGDVESILEDMESPGELRTGGLPSYFHPGRSARFDDLAIFGEVHPEVLERLKIRRRVLLAEIDVERVLSQPSLRSVRAVPRFPAIRRDFSFLLDKGTQYAALRNMIISEGIPELVRIEPFDRMESGPFAESKYSLSISVIYQSTERTLTDSAVESFDRRILEVLEQRLGAQLRK